MALDAFNSIVQEFIYAATARNSQEAIATSEERITYTQLLERIESVHTYLVSRSIRPLEKVAWATVPSSSFIQLLYAVTLTEAVGVPLNPSASVDEWCAQCVTCDVRMLLVSPPLAPKALEVFARCESLRGVAIISGEKGMPEINNLAQRPGEYDPGDSQPGDALILCTSGTTGQPKGVVLTHSSLAANYQSVTEYMELVEGDSMLVVKPLFHSSTMIELLSTLHTGGRLVIEPWLMARGTIARAQKERCSILCLVPTMVRELLTYLDSRIPTDLALRAISVSGAPVAGRVLCELAAKIPDCGIFHVYGLTEASPRVTALLPHELAQHSNSIGRPIPRVEADVVREDGTTAPVGTVGELIVRGANLMRAYYRNPAATHRVLKPEGLHTGDLAIQDAEGYIYLRGRCDDLINCGGQKVYPGEIEQILLEHPAVAEAMVQGIADNRLGQIPIAWLVPAAEHVPDIDTIRQFCAQHLSAYKVPRQISWCNTLLRTATGKIKRGT